MTKIKKRKDKTQYKILEVNGVPVYASAKAERLIKGLSEFEMIPLTCGIKSFVEVFIELDDDVGAFLTLIFRPNEERLSVDYYARKKICRVCLESEL